MAIWKSYRIVEVIADIEDEKFVLPVIQRRLVWDEEKMQLLFDTLLKGDSFGGIMVIEEEKDSKCEARRKALPSGSRTWRAGERKDAMGHTVNPCTPREVERAKAADRL
jgi:hypothetical protein